MGHWLRLRANVVLGVSLSLFPSALHVFPEWEAPQMQGFVAEEVAREFANFRRRFSRVSRQIFPTKQDIATFNGDGTSFCIQLEKTVSALSNKKDEDDRKRKSSENSSRGSEPCHAAEYCVQDTDSGLRGDSKTLQAESCREEPEPERDALVAGMLEGIAPEAALVGVLEQWHYSITERFDIPMRNLLQYEHSGLTTVVQSTSPTMVRWLKPVHKYWLMCARLYRVSPWPTAPIPHAPHPY